MSGSLLDDLAARAAPLVETQTAKWTSYLVDALTTKLLPQVPSALQGAVAAAVQALKDNEALLAGTTAHGFTALVSHLALGQEDQARMVWLSSSADFDAEMKALDDAFAATRADAEAKAKQWATVKGIALSILEAGGKAAVPLLLTLVGL